jgi:hypothetical protein
MHLPFKMIAARLGIPEKSSQLTGSPGIDNRELFCDLVRVIELASRHTPWQSRCLVQSICLILFLKLYRLPYTLCIGLTRLAAPDNQGTMAAHAWVMAGEQIASWNSDHMAYVPVCQFVSRRIAMNAALQFPTDQ